MATVVHGRKWNSRITSAEECILITRVLDFNNSLIKKEVYNITLGLGGVSTTQTTFTIYYRFATGGDDLTTGWKVFGSGSGVGRTGDNVVIPVSGHGTSSSDSNIITTVVLDDNGQEVSTTKLTNIFNVQFKIKYSSLANNSSGTPASKDAIELNDINIEYRTLRKRNINEAQVE